MSLSRQPLSITGGLDTSRALIRSDLTSFRTMHNLRQSQQQPGQIELTPAFYLYKQLSQGTYWISGSTTEAATSPVLAFWQLTSTMQFYVTGFVVWRFLISTAQIRHYYRSASPANTGATKQCNIVVNSVFGLNLTLGSTLDIEIDGATTFKWRKNGGAYTTLVPITTSGVSIDGGNATVYFITASGFTVADVWSWQRTDTHYNSGGGAVCPQITDHVIYKERVYFLSGSELNVLKADSSGTYYTISVGYAPIFGNSLAVFNDHLFVGGASATAINSFSYLAGSGVVANSDLADLDQFFATDVNEADQVTLATNTKAAYARHFVRGMATINNRVYAFVSTGFWASDYPGLPIVFSFYKQQEVLAIDLVFQNGEYVFITTVNGPIYRFDGSNLIDISRPIYNTIRATSYRITHYTYDRLNNEHVFFEASLSLIYVWQESLGTWYTRAVNITGNAPSRVVFVDDVYTTHAMFIGAANLRLYTEDKTYVQTPVAVTDATPRLTTQGLTGPSLATVKELTSIFLGVDVTSTTVGAGYYSGTSIRIAVSYYVPASGILQGSPTTGETWSTTTPNSTVTKVRTSFRCLVITLTIAGTDSSKPPGGVILTAIEPELSNGMMLTPVIK